MSLIATAESVPSERTADDAAATRTQTRDPAATNRARRGWTAALIAAVIAGAVFRLVWVGDMEYKSDEERLFVATQEYLRTGVLPADGLPSSVGVMNPPLSVWAFDVPARLFGITTPTGLARFVEVSAVLALLLLVWFAVGVVDRREREIWLWTVALAAVNPLALLVQRKIWSPSILPLLLVLALIAWWRRARPAGAFLWGATTMVAAQIFAGGWFLIGGLIGWVAMFDRQRFRWAAWIAGSAVGALPMLVWILRMPSHDSSFLVYGFYDDARNARFWTRWAARPLGFSVDYSLGADYGTFLSEPVVAGHALHLVLVAHAVAAAIGAFVLLRAAIRWGRARREWAATLTGRNSQTLLVVNAAVLGVGLLFSASGLPLHRHYFDALFPLGFAWFAVVARMPPFASPEHARVDRMLLATLCVAQAVMSAMLLVHIHANGGVPGGDYGVAYRAQASASVGAP